MNRKRKTYIIAEAGINHNGSLDNCFRLIDAAVDAGCDCVKFQFFSAKRLYPRSAGRLDWEDRKGKYSYDIYSAVESFELPSGWVDSLIQYCKERKIDFLSSVFDEKGANYLVKRGMKAIKLPSYSITNLPLIDYCARLKLPIIMSTGGANLGEVEEAVSAVNKHHNKLALLHCSIKYPTPLDKCNLGVINTLRLAFPVNKIGYSDHTKEVSRAPVQAVYLGSEIIEKHMTLDKNMPGPDHFFALNPVELRKMVADIRIAEKRTAAGKIKIDKALFGNTRKIVNENERYLRGFCYSSIFAKREIKKGQRINHNDLAILRAGKKMRGLEPKYMALFKNYPVFASKDIRCEDPITWKVIFDA